MQTSVIHALWQVAQFNYVKKKACFGLVWTCHPALPGVPNPKITDTVNTRPSITREVLTNLESFLEESDKTDQEM